MDETGAPGAATPRRTFLTLLALAPAAAACAGSGGVRARPSGRPDAADAAAGATAAASPVGEVPADPLAAIREFPLRAGSEPAFVFRAAAARPGP